MSANTPTNRPFPYWGKRVTQTTANRPTTYHQVHRPTNHL